MTSIPAFVQQFSSTQPVRQKPQTNGNPSNDFGKILEKQKSGSEPNGKTEAAPAGKTDAAPEDRKNADPVQSSEGKDQTGKTQEPAGAAENTESRTDVQDQKRMTDPVQETAQEQDAQITDQPAEGLQIPEAEDIVPEIVIPETTENLTEDVPSSGKETIAPVTAVPKKEAGEISQEELLAMEVLQSAVWQIGNALQETLGIGTEELNDILEELSYTPQDLLNPEKLTDVVLEAAKEKEPAALLTNEQLFTDHRLLQGELSEIQKGLQQNGLFRNAEEKGLYESKEQRIDPATELTPSVETGIQNQTGGEVLSSFGRQNKDDQRGGTDQQERSLQSPFMTYTANAQPQVQEFTEATPQSPIPQMQIPDPNGVTQQVLDHLRMNLRADTQEINLQLHPESLGNLHIQISAKEGVMTAHFTAANEEVKGILENQMVILRENLENQDIKVEAIEITVQTHGFEENLEQGKGSGTEEQPSKRRRRSLSLEGLSEEASLNEEEQLIAEMMIANGSTVDYQA